jgi:lipopolysaccharide transport system ATP-binding protein
MYSNNIAVKVTNLAKCYEIYATPRDRLKQFFIPRILRFLGKHPVKYFREFWATKDISFEIKKGETIAIIGRNGSGKSTLLQMICGTLTPTSGSIETSGRVAALLELGSGFNPEFTGRENVYLNASVLGLKKEEIDARFDDIVLFADIGSFIEQPVKTYSSGMYVRLAFAVIMHVNAEILVVDEALSVGDVFFQQKCMRYLRSFQKNGGTIIFVSHDTSAVVSLCDRAILLRPGKEIFIGDAKKVCGIYIEDVYSARSFPDQSVINKKSLESSKPQSVNQANFSRPEILFKGGVQNENIINISPFQSDAHSFGAQGAKIIDVWFESSTGQKLASIAGGDLVNFFIKVEANKEIKFPAFGFMIKDRLGQYVIAEGTDLAFRKHLLILNPGDVAQVEFSFFMPILFQGDYPLNIAFAEGMGDDHIQHHWINDAIVLHSLQSRLVHGICGLQDLNIKIKIFSGIGAQLV